MTSLQAQSLVWALRPRVLGLVTSYPSLRSHQGLLEADTLAWKTVEDAPGYSSGCVLGDHGSVPGCSSTCPHSWLPQSSAHILCLVTTPARCSKNTPLEQQCLKRHLLALGGYPLLPYCHSKVP